MTGSDTPIGEDDLVAWVDDRLDPNRRAAVEARLEADPALRERLLDERRQRDALRAVLAGKAAEPIPARLRVSAIEERRRRHRAERLRSVAAALLIFVAGGGVGLLSGRLLPARETAVAPLPAAQVVAEDAGLAHRTFVVEVAHPVEVEAGREAHLMQWLSKRLGRRLVAPDLAGFGWRLMGGRLLPGESGAAAQLMYEDGTGRRLTVWVEAGRGGETAFRFAEAGGTATWAWIDRGFGFAVTAPASRDQLLPIAEAIHHGFEAGDGAAGRG